ncbi:MAG: adenylyl-sulfate kinase [Proteobacteria bacterium]|nr:adenylyl-sulfate kinase [Pseudomonadota bacterium]MBI3497508.1 adenylyl-sulfate kinase [Pseudomonadota bacterium]
MAAEADDAPLKVAVVGHVDHGKSTLVARLVHDTGSLPEGKVEAIKAMSERRGMPFEWAFLLDALQAERDQGITIDTSEIRFRTQRRSYVLIDAPGHKEFLKNMVTGAASADAALLVIDAKEGVQEQSRRHGYLLHLLGVRQVGVAINKMDLAQYDQGRFLEVAAAMRAYLDEIGVNAASYVPVSGRGGDGIVGPAATMPWYRGPSLADLFDGFERPSSPVDRPLRLPVQDVYKFDERRIVVGRVESGRLKVGDRLTFAPGAKSARIASIEAWHVPEPPKTAEAGQSIGITLDEPIFLERGHVAHHENHPPIETHVFRARLFWLGREPLVKGKRYKLKLATAEHWIEVQSIERVIDAAELKSQPGHEVPRNGIAEVVLRARSTIVLDEYAELPRTGRFVLVDGYDLAGGGTITMEGYPRQRQSGVRSTNLGNVEHRVDLTQRWAANGHKSGILWFTGLSGAGKTTLAIELEQRLFRKGWHVYVLDGDNVRHGLSADLAFSPEDRAENVRRVGEVAALFAGSGVLVIAAFISPYRADRDRVRAIAPALFHEVFVKADLGTCEGRDPKGLYRKARAGLITDFTGVSAPYEEPEAPELVVDTGHAGIEDCLSRLVDYVERGFALDAASGGR